MSAYYRESLREAGAPVPLHVEDGDEVLRTMLERVDADGEIYLALPEELSDTLLRAATNTTPTISGNLDADQGEEE